MSFCPHRPERIQLGVSDAATPQSTVTHYRDGKEPSEWGKIVNAVQLLTGRLQQ